MSRRALAELLRMGGMERASRLVRPIEPGQRRVEQATRSQRATDKARLEAGAIGAGAGVGATAAGYEAAKALKSDDESRRQAQSAEEMYRAVLTPDEMDVLEEYTRTKASKGSATKKAMGGKVGRGCGAAMRGGGAVMRKGRM